MKEFPILEHIDTGRIFNEAQKERLKLKTKELIEEIVNEEVDVLFFMDRSARPIYWMLEEAWDQYSGGYKNQQ